MRVQAFRAKSAVERLDEGIVGRLTWPGEVERDVVLIRPEIEIARHKLAALVDPDHLRVPRLLANKLERCDHI